MSAAPPFRLMASGACPLLLVCGDTAPQRRQLLSRAHARLAADCPSAAPQTRWQRYRRDAWAEQIWQQLLPVLEPWSDLLEGRLIGSDPPASREIPGLDPLLACLIPGRSLRRSRRGPGRRSRR